MNNPAPKTTLLGSNPHRLHYDGEQVSRAVWEALAALFAYLLLLTLGFFIIGNLSGGMIEKINEQNQSNYYNQSRERWETQPSEFDRASWDAGVRKYGLWVSLGLASMMALITVVTYAVETPLAWLVGNWMGGQAEFYQFYFAITRLNLLTVFTVLLGLILITIFSLVVGAWWVLWAVFIGSGLGTQLLVHAVRAWKIGELHEIGWLQGLVASIGGMFIASFILSYLWGCLFFVAWIIFIPVVMAGAS